MTDYNIKYEYYVIRKEYYEPLSENELNKIGSNRWKLVSTINLFDNKIEYVFIRQK